MKRKQREGQAQETLPASTTSQVITAVQYYQMSLIEKARYGASFGIPTTLIFALLGSGEGSLVLGLIVGLSTGYFSEEVKSGLIDKLPRPREKPGARRRKLRWWLTGESDHDDQPSPAHEVPQQHDSRQTVAPPLSDIDRLFQMGREQEKPSSIPRLLPNDIIRHTEPDDYQICIGRSLTKPGNPPVWINFYCQHLKIIGASQYGKSSMAAYILYVITRTHAPENVQIALLDLEHKTSKLFTTCDHVARVTINGQPVTLHARSYEEVLEHLGHCVEIMNQRYRLSEAEAEQEPLLVVYVEEFLDLKDHFKKLVDATSGDDKEAAKKDYAQLVFRVSQLARRGLKAKLQLLLCAQVDYRDEDFREALVNITGGMSFNVDPPAARAAGFIRGDLLKRNMEENKRGQAVTETLDCKDLVLAPQYDLREKLRALDKRRRQAAPLPGGKQTTIIAPAATRELPDEEVTAHLPEEPPDEELDEPGGMVILGKDQVTGKTVSITREQFEVAVNLRECGMSTGYRDLMKPFGLSEHHAKVLNQKIRTILEKKPIDIASARTRE